MKRFFSPSQNYARTRPARTGTGPLLMLLFAGLLTDVVPHDEAYASLDYALALLALLGAAGSIAGFTYKLSRSIDPLPWNTPVTPGPLVPATLSGAWARGERWPLLVALLLCPFAVLLAGLGGWV